MLGWVTGASRSQADDSIDPGDAPETPAHIFAARAFKSLLFGTPTSKDMTTEKPKRFSRLSDIAGASRRHSSEVVSDQISRSGMQPRHSDFLASPSKGILVAPGSVSTKRKSVTFGDIGRDIGTLENAREQNQSDSEESYNPPFTAAPKNIDPTQEDLRRSLFETRTQSSKAGIMEEKAKNEATTVTMGDDNKNIVVNQPPFAEKVAEQALQPRRVSTILQERTIDLDQPFSTSGQHWKREYERDHDNSKAEMKRLIHYNQMTKSYAEKRDRDAVMVTQKLNDAEAKAKLLEKKVQKLAAQLMDARTQDDEQKFILGEVASQTAEVMKYKSKAERYRAELRQHGALQVSTDEDEGKKGIGMSKDVNELQSDLARLKIAADRAEARAAKADKENAMLHALLQQMKKAKEDIVEHYDKLHDHLKQRQNNLLQDNRRLNHALNAVNSKFSSVRDELQSLKNANQTISKHKALQNNARLFDLKQSRLMEEPSPPTSNEDLRKQDTMPSGRVEYGMVLPQMDFSITDETSRRSPQKRLGVAHDKHRGEESAEDIRVPKTVICTRRMSGKYDQLPDSRPIKLAGLGFESIPAMKVNPTDLQDDHNSTSFRKSSPLMKSFIDNLGTRQVLPPERVEAAKRRLEQKAADRRSSTPKKGKVV